MFQKVRIQIVLLLKNGKSDNITAVISKDAYDILKERLYHCEGGVKINCHETNVYTVINMNNVSSVQVKFLESI